jgi:hypothetical protein
MAAMTLMDHCHHYLTKKAPGEHVLYGPMLVVDQMNDKKPEMGVRVRSQRLLLELTPNLSWDEVQCTINKQLEESTTCSCGMKALVLDNAASHDRRCRQCKLVIQVVREVVELLFEHLGMGCCLIACAMVARFAPCEILEGYMIIGKEYYYRHYVLSWRGMIIDPGTEVTRRVMGKIHTDSVANAHFSLPRRFSSTRPPFGSNLAESPEEIQVERGTESYFKLLCEDPNAFWALTLPWQREWVPSEWMLPTAFVSRPL